jgi:hypothetical protein
VINEANGDILYTVRIQGSSFKPHVYAPGSYTVRIGRNRPNAWSRSGLKPDDAGTGPLLVELK